MKYLIFTCLKNPMYPISTLYLPLQLYKLIETYNEKKFFFTLTWFDNHSMYCTFALYIHT